MATPIKPASHLEWVPSNNPASVIEPPRALREAGYSEGESPAFQHFNFLFYLTDQWIKWLDQASYSTAMVATADSGMRLLGGGTWSFNATTRALAWSEAFTVAIPGQPDATNSVAAGQVTLPDGHLTYVNANVPMTTTVDTVSGSDLLRQVAYGGAVAVGQKVQGTGIPAGATVLNVSTTDGEIEVRISAPATADGDNILATFIGADPVTVATGAADQFVVSPTRIIIARAQADRAVVGINSGQMALRDNEAKPLLGGGYVTTLTATAGRALTARQPVYLAPAAGDVAVMTATYSNASNTLTVASTAALEVGSGVSGPNIPGGATITALPSGTSVQISAPTSGPGAGVSVTFTRVGGKAYPVSTAVDLGAVRSAMVGFTLTAAAAGSPVTIVSDGVLPGFGSSLTAGRVYYVDPTTGNLSTTMTAVANTYVLAAGVALDANTLDINSAMGTAAQRVAPAAQSWPTYFAGTVAELAAALTGLATDGGGVLVVSAPITITEVMTVPAGTIVQGRKGVPTLTVNQGGGLILSERCELRDLTVVSNQTSGRTVDIAGDHAMVRGCSLKATQVADMVLVYVGASGVRLLDNIFYGVMVQSTTARPFAIDYAVAQDNLDDGSTFAS